MPLENYSKMITISTTGLLMFKDLVPGINYKIYFAVFNGYVLNSFTDHYIA